ncbi:hypothetical protein BDP27DRAFT_1342360 [Rhodocollybia butyracea]|uniref:Uncharacterized protein n=1 Tax=Rhodocollybia butyracea TaxID=206335 RepID=A0A9P5PBA0_9AGAR|nr:hypothetical protein BDP27DRAFT_1342360 [Rhodocollybia butyracea]
MCRPAVYYRISPPLNFKRKLQPKKAAEHEPAPLSTKIRSRRAKRYAQNRYRGNWMSRDSMTS